MDQYHRYLIQKNLRVLVGVNLDLIIPELLNEGIIFEEDVNSIREKYTGKDERALEFFLRYRTRGPTAFGILIDTLKRKGYEKEVEYLLNEDTDQFENLTPPPSISHSEEGSFDEVRQIVNGESHDETGNGTIINGNGRDAFGDDAISVNDEGDQRIQKAILYNQGITDEGLAYPMMSRPKGFALIINNINFPGNESEKRLGADRDSDNLYRLLTDLGLKVTHNLKDVTKKELLDPENGILKKFLDQFNGPEKVDCCFVAFMSHGEDGLLRTSDQIILNRLEASYVKIHEDILTRFNNLHCPALIGKPKIFVIPACRGYERDRGVRQESHTRNDALNEKEQLNKESPLAQRIPEWGDMIICYSTVPGKVSNRDIHLGTWYIESLCKIWRSNAHNTDLIHLLQAVGREMQNIRSENGEKQMSEYVDRGFNRDFYFNPGLYE